MQNFCLTFQLNLACTHKSCPGLPLPATSCWWGRKKVNLSTNKDHLACLPANSCALRILVMRKMRIFCYLLLFCKETKKFHKICCMSGNSFSLNFVAFSFLDLGGAQRALKLNFANFRGKYVEKYFFQSWPLLMCLFSTSLCIVGRYIFDEKKSLWGSVEQYFNSDSLGLACGRWQSTD